MNEVQGHELLLFHSAHHDFNQQPFPSPVDRDVPKQKDINE